MPVSAFAALLMYMRSAITEEKQHKALSALQVVGSSVHVLKPDQTRDCCLYLARTCMTATMSDTGNCKQL